jgi:NifB/MoaA-like Fe-S oxidoreductase
MYHGDLKQASKMNRFVCRGCSHGAKPYYNESFGPKFKKHSTAELTGLMGSCWHVMKVLEKQAGMDLGVEFSERFGFKSWYPHCDICPVFNHIHYYQNKERGFG